MDARGSGTGTAAAPTGRRLEQRLARAMASAIEDFAMIAEGDRILVAVSGGKDSFTLHHLLHALSERAPVRFSLLAATIDQGQPGFASEPIASYMRSRGHEFCLVREDTFSIVTDKIPPGKTRCSLCSRLRRGILYRLATEHGCSKIALGHHRDDLIETLLLNIFFAGQLGSMPPKLLSDDGDHVVIRPLAYCAEEDIVAYAKEMSFPVTTCSACGSQSNLKRRAMATLLANLERDQPGIRASALAAMMNVRPSQLPDVDLWRRLGLTVAAGEAADTADEGSRG